MCFKAPQKFLFFGKPFLTLHDPSALPWYFLLSLREFLKTKGWALASLCPRGLQGTHTQHQQVFVESIIVYSDATDLTFVSPPHPKFIGWNPNSQRDVNTKGGTFGRWLEKVMEGGVHDGINALPKRCRIFVSALQREDGHLQTGKRAPTRHCICWHLELELPSLQNYQ